MFPFYLLTSHLMILMFPDVGSDEPAFTVHVLPHCESEMAKSLMKNFSRGSLFQRVYAPGLRFLTSFFTYLLTHLLAYLLACLLTYLLTYSIGLRAGAPTHDDLQPAQLRSVGRGGADQRASRVEQE